MIAGPWTLISFAGFSGVETKVNTNQNYFSELPRLIMGSGMHKLVARLSKSRSLIPQYTTTPKVTVRTETVTLPFTVLG